MSGKTKHNGSTRGSRSSTSSIGMFYLRSRSGTLLPCLPSFSCFRQTNRGFPMTATPPIPIALNATRNGSAAHPTRYSVSPHRRAKHDCTPGRFSSTRRDFLFFALRLFIFWVFICLFALGLSPYIFSCLFFYFVTSVYSFVLFFFIFCVYLSFFFLPLMYR